MNSAKKEHSSRKAAPMKQSINWRLIILTLTGTAIAVLSGLYMQKHTNETNLKKKLHSQSQQLESKIDALNKQTTTSQQLEAEKLKLKQELEAAQKALQAKKAKQTVYAATPVAKPVTSVINGWHRDCQSQKQAVKAVVDSMGLGGQWVYMDYIFSRESCIDPGRINSIGCKGLGQSCGHASFTCGPADIACQITWFNNYANGLGGWYKSYQIWQSKHWW